jgi:hypothetical protein
LPRTDQQVTNGITKEIASIQRLRYEIHKQLPAHRNIRYKIEEERKKNHAPSTPFDCTTLIQWILLHPHKDRNHFSVNSTQVVGF